MCGANSAARFRAGEIELAIGLEHRVTVAREAIEVLGRCRRPPQEAREVAGHSTYVAAYFR